MNEVDVKAIETLAKAAAASDVLAKATANAAETLAIAAERAAQLRHDTHSDTPERLIRIETIVTTLQTRLLGNGQPGELQKLQMRMVDLEAFKSYTKGGMAALSLLVFLLGGFETLRLLKLL